MHSVICTHAQSSSFHSCLKYNSFADELINPPHRSVEVIEEGWMYALLREILVRSEDEVVVLQRVLYPKVHKIGFEKKGLLVSHIQPAV
jgi:hypothetical protein